MLAVRFPVVRHTPDFARHILERAPDAICKLTRASNWATNARESSAHSALHPGRHRSRAFGYLGDLWFLPIWRIQPPNHLDYPPHECSKGDTGN